MLAELLSSAFFLSFIPILVGMGGGRWERVVYNGVVVGESGILLK